MDSDKLPPVVAYDWYERAQDARRRANALRRQAVELKQKYRTDTGWLLRRADLLDIEAAEFEERADSVAVLIDLMVDELIS